MRNHIMKWAMKYRKTKIEEKLICRISTTKIEWYTWKVFNSWMNECRTAEYWVWVGPQIFSFSVNTWHQPIHAHLWGVWTNSELQLFYHTFICVELLWSLWSMIHICIFVSAMKTVFMDIKHILNVCYFIILL